MTSERRVMYFYTGFLIGTGGLWPRFPLFPLILPFSLYLFVLLVRRWEMTAKGGYHVCLCSRLFLSNVSHSIWLGLRLRLSPTNTLPSLEALAKGWMRVVLVCVYTPVWDSSSLFFSFLLFSSWGFICVCKTSSYTNHKKAMP